MVSVVVDLVGRPHRTRTNLPCYYNLEEFAELNGREFEC